MLALAAIYAQRPRAVTGVLDEAARLASLDEFVAGLPSGCETPIGDDGGTLSGGVRQRVAIARAVLRRPALLVLDEPTAHLDVPTVESIVRNLRQALPGTTLLVVTHDHEVARQCDRTVTLEDGRFIADETAREFAARLR